MRTLLAQIYEQGQFWNNAITQKRGLFNALSEHGSTMDFDYLANDKATLFDGFVNRIDYHQPDLVFTQFHSGDPYILDGMRRLRSLYPELTFVNWSGDSWAWSLTSAPILELAHEFDLWLCAAPDVLPVYEANGIRAAFWQIAYEPPVLPLPEMPAYDVVFLGNIISEKRRDLRNFLRSLDGVKVGIYGDGDGVDGHNTYDFAAGEALYRNAKIAIADAAYVDQQNYVSNRPLQIMGAGGAILLHQHVDKMGELVEGIKDGRHYVEWSDFDDLRYWINNVMRDVDIVNRAVVDRAHYFVHKHHTYRNRVDQLLGMLEGLKADG